MIRKANRSKLWIVYLVLALILVNYIVSQIHFRLDLTKEKRFTITQPTKELLKDLDEPVEIQVFLAGELSSGYRKLGDAAEELLSEFRSHANRNLTFSFVQPAKGLSDSARYNLYDSFRLMGIEPQPDISVSENEDAQSQRLVFPSAIARYKDLELPINLLSSKSGMTQESTLNYSENLLEYKFAEAIHKLTRKTVPVVAYAVGNGEPLNPTVNDLFNTLRNNYRLGVLDLKNGYIDADSVNALLIVKPSKAFSDVEKLKIDQYVMQGGRVMWLIDKVYAEFDSLLRAQSDFVAFDKNLNLEDQLFRYGVRINTDLVQDLKCARQPLVVGNVGNQPQVQRIPFPYYPLLAAPPDQTSVITKNVGDVLSVFPSSIDTVKAAGITKTILLSTDSNSRTLSTPAVVSLQSVKSEDDFQLFRRSFIPIAVLLEGQFTSLYRNRLTQELRDTLARYHNKPFADAGVKPGKQIVISDADLITNVVSGTEGPLPMGVQLFENYQFANREFLMNCIDYLVSDRNILV
ncbi:MAG TPA: gliding motility-associated ABC transporter substrate-binding protein GldG, partial [Chitinophagaceae bacterium]